jgi:superfamily II DNA or RNA helicase
MVKIAFKRMLPAVTVPETPGKLLLHLPQRPIPDVLPHQQEVMRNYADLLVGAPDVALQLPTSSGKTLVGSSPVNGFAVRTRNGLSILCSTRQLVNQARVLVTELRARPSCRPTQAGEIASDRGNVGGVRSSLGAAFVVCS